MRLSRPGSGKNVRDARGQGGGSGGGFGGMPIPGGGMAGGGIIVIIGIIAAILLGGNVLGSGGGGPGGSLDDIGASAPAPGSGDVPDPDLELKQFVSAVLDDVQQYWAQQFSAGGKRYEDAQLVLFNRPIDTGGCGVAASSSGPFYCPADQAVYLELGFFRELRTRFGAPGDFAQAYVLAHELGHHVQNLLGIDSDVRRQQEDDPSRRNDLSVRLELQADCLAGVWGYSAYDRGELEPGDLEEGLAAAAAVGDDRLGARSSEEWTHGSSALRVKWFSRGFETGTASSCDTFSGAL